MFMFPPTRSSNADRGRGVPWKTAFKLEGSIVKSHHGRQLHGLLRSCDRPGRKCRLDHGVSVKVTVGTQKADNASDSKKRVIYYEKKRVVYVASDGKRFNPAGTGITDGIW